MANDDDTLFKAAMEPVPFHADLAAVLIKYIPDTTQAAANVIAESILEHLAGLFRTMEKMETVWDQEEKGSDDEVGNTD